MVSVTNPLMDSEIWGANLTGKCVVCRSDKAVAPHPTMGRYICLMRRWCVLSGLRRVEPPRPRGFSSS